MTPMTSTMRSLDARELSQRQRWPEAPRALDGHKPRGAFLTCPPALQAWAQPGLYWVGLVVALRSSYARLLNSSSLMRGRERPLAPWR
jgi:hypothetical protein